MESIQFTIRRDPNNTSDDALEYWVYEKVQGVTQRGKYIIVKLPHMSAFIPGEWVTHVQEINEETT
tara:strand:+ start:2522 stop:2719 length:198 start_codon:yes stop_codon:yes gene_type:complete